MYSTPNRHVVRDICVAKLSLTDMCRRYLALWPYHWGPNSDSSWEIKTPLAVLSPKNEKINMK